MRVSICTDHKSIVRQIVWLNESRSVVYVGMYDEKANPHTSYHADGLHHVKITQQGKELVIFEEQRKPNYGLITSLTCLKMAAPINDDDSFFARAVW